MKSFYFLALLLIAAASCQEKETTQIITIPNKYSLEIPSNLTKAESLNDDASLQYQNLYNELYVIVIDESKQTIDDLFQLAPDSESNLERYTQTIKDNFSTSITNPVFSKLETIEINGLKAQTYSLSGSIEGIDVCYELAFIKGRFNYYQILTWTELSKKERHSEKMKAMIASFKELKNNKIKKRLPN